MRLGSRPATGNSGVFTRGHPLDQEMDRGARAVGRRGAGNDMPFSCKNHVLSQFVRWTGTEIRMYAGAGLAALCLLEPPPAARSFMQNRPPRRATRFPPSLARASTAISHEALPIFSPPNQS